MKIELKQEMQDEYGKPVCEGNKPPKTLRDIIVFALLQSPRNAMTGLVEPEEDKVKMDKYKIFKKILKSKDNVDLEAEEVSLIKKLILRWWPTIIAGEANEMIEGKYERIEVDEQIENKKLGDE